MQNPTPIFTPQASLLHSLHCRKRQLHYWRSTNQRPRNPPDLPLSLSLCFSFFSLISHIQPIRKSCCLYLQNITKMQRLLTTSPFLACSETLSSLKYCIGLLTNLSFLPPKCHSPSPILARVMILKWKTDHLMSVLKTPCWLPISFKVKAKPLRVVPKLHVICTHTHRHPLPPFPTCSLPLLVVFFLSLLDTKQKLA